MKKIISFSLWGDNPKYTIGALKNAAIAKKLFPDWICRFYCGSNTPSEIIDELKFFKNVEVIEMTEGGDWNSMFWRFLACEDSDVMISRDTDSRLSNREKEAIEEWLNSDKDFHIMRDHPFHNMQILGGMWGCRNGVLKDIRDLIENYEKGNYWQIDQEFLRDIIYQKIKNTVFVHDEFFNFEDVKKPFPSPRNNREFVGDVFDENENRHPEYYKFINE